MSVSNKKIQTNILLESGTNELEIMEFTIAGDLYGINVAKVREIIMAQKVKYMPGSHPSIEGVVKPRDEMFTVIDLGKYLKLPDYPRNDSNYFIISSFNNMSFAFRVESVIGINRISWKNIRKPDRIIYSGEDGAATGIAEYDDKLITILDFERIIAEISPESSIQMSAIEKLGSRHVNPHPILIAEDSMLLSKLIIECLHKAGYTNIIKTDNGEEAWKYLSEAKSAEENIKNYVTCVISDIEMPLIDGHKLTKLIKEDPTLKSIPVILFSSLIDEQMRIKGEKVGADAQITKPEIDKLVTIIDEFIN